MLLKVSLSFPERWVPLKLMLFGFTPSYTLPYGGGIVSGDSISCEFTIGDGCTTVLTTQASTKVYKSLGSKCCEQVLEKSHFCGVSKSWERCPFGCHSRSCDTFFPSKVGSSETDAVWVYTMVVALSLYVYKSVGSKCCEQVLEVNLGNHISVQ
ncbi:uncharacterized protein LOC117627888 isoform X1 [Prunus dulcis]|uniref:uncharacterized protein LOC117627888 isoform X1 n=2 Tax=Prunus dulcis TaxID=3755 RepID=UPI001481EA30|nr:uncharacterized protein LOC117627888 isoform X1 [Prunus dulcis]